MLGLPYDKALKHQKECDFRKKACPKRCGRKLFGKDIPDHLPKCLNFSTTCDDCQITSYPNRGDFQADEKHDCFTSLVRETQKNEKELYVYEEALGINYNVVNNKCPKDKPMIVHRGPVLQDQSDGRTTKCADCQKEPLDSHILFYRCKEAKTCGCDYNLCRHCALTMCDPPVLKEKQTFPFH